MAQMKLINELVQLNLEKESPMIGYLNPTHASALENAQGAGSCKALGVELNLLI